MMNQSKKFDFCPKCGALTRDGVCQSCGYHLKNSVSKSDADKEAHTYSSGQVYRANQDMSNGTKQTETDGRNRVEQNRVMSQQQNIDTNPEINQGYAGQYKKYEENQRNVNQGYNQNQGYNKNQGNQYQGNNIYIPNDLNATQNKKSNTTVIVAVTIGITMFVLFIIVIVAFSFLVLYTVNEESVTADSYNNDYSGEDEPYADPDMFGYEEKRGAEENLEPKGKTNGEDPFLADGYVNNWGTNHDNYSKDEFSGDYYESICECIDESVDYKINREFYDYESPDSNVVIRVAFYQLEGDIPNIDELNDEILAYSAYMAGNYFDNYPEGSDYEGIIELNTDSYVTFNDSKIMSIVLNEYWNIDGGTGFDLYGINVDLQNGVLFENNEILDIDEGFAGTFRKRNNIQNEYDGKIEAVDEITDQEIADSLNDTTTSIIFYTPMGMEVGYNYTYNDYYGWVTVTFKDYEQFLKSF